MTLKTAVLTFILACSGAAAAQGNVVYDGRLPTPKPRVSAQQQVQIKQLAASAFQAGAWNRPDFRPVDAGCDGRDFEIQGVAPGAFTVKGAKQTAYLYTYCSFRPSRSQGLVITEGSKVLAHYTFDALHSEMYALKDINRNGYTELALSGGFTGQGYTTSYLEIAELAPQRRLLASFNSQNKLAIREDNCGVAERGVWEGRVIRVMPGPAPRFTQQVISGRCGNDRTATSQGTAQAVKPPAQPTGWNTVPVSSPGASGNNILGTATPFSKTALCQRVGCQVVGNAQVGGYLFATYAPKNSYAVGTEGYFAFLKNGKTVAVGVYALGSQDITTAGTRQDLKDLVDLTGKTLPSLKGLMVSAYGPDHPIATHPDDLVLRRDRDITLPLGGGMVLTNASQRTALAKAGVLDQSSSSLRFTDVAYVALASEAGAVSRLINRWSPAEQKEARQTYLKAMELTSACPAKLASGRTLRMSQIERTSPWITWAVARGYTINGNTAYVGLALPGFALSAVEITSSGGGTMEELYNAPLCVR